MSSGHPGSPFRHEAGGSGRPRVACRRAPRAGPVGLGSPLARVRAPRRAGPGGPPPAPRPGSVVLSRRGRRPQVIDAHLCEKVKWCPVRGRIRGVRAQGWRDAAEVDLVGAPGAGTGCGAAGHAGSRWWSRVWWSMPPGVAWRCSRPSQSMSMGQAASVTAAAMASSAVSNAASSVPAVTSQTKVRPMRTVHRRGSAGSRRR